MQSTHQLWPSPHRYLVARRPDDPVAFFCPRVLRATAGRFLQGFPGLVTYAVKANPDPEVLTNLHLSGITAFDVASPVEIDHVRRFAPGAAMHYNNPVRAPAEIAHAVAAGVTSYSVDSERELDKLLALVPQEAEIAVRLKLPVGGAAYDFGEKFGADPDTCASLLARVAAAGRQPALTFHPGTQCTNPDAWVTYIAACGDIVARSRTPVRRLNVGGGFPSDRGTPARLDPIFSAIAKARTRHLPGVALVCEPGRAMVADAISIATRVKAIRACGTVFLNDGLYGTLAELRDDMPTSRIATLSPDGHARAGAVGPRRVFGPTCDSLDCLPGKVDLPVDLQEGDYLLFGGLGAYGTAIATRFNGYGTARQVTVAGF